MMDIYRTMGESVITFTRIWIQPEDRDVNGTVHVVPCVVFEVVGGHKKYMRLWLHQEQPPEVEWGWVLHESAVLVWAGDSSDPKSLTVDEEAHS